MRTNSPRWAAMLVAIAAPVAAADLEPRFIQPRLIRESPAVLEFGVPAELRDRWVRLRNHRGFVWVNGVAVPARASDRVTSTVALSPYLKVSGLNRIEATGFSAEGPRIEALPRVFLAGAATSPGKLRILIENTLENAANVQVDVGGAGSRSAYVPPESQFEVEFAEILDHSAVVRLTKFAEAIEEGYSTSATISSLARIELQQNPNGAMVLGRDPNSNRSHILERPPGRARPTGRRDSWPVDACGR